MVINHLLTGMVLQVHPGRLTWNLRIHLLLPGKSSEPNHDFLGFLGSRLIFGVCLTMSFWGGGFLVPCSSGSVLYGHQNSEPHNCSYQGTIGCTPNNVPMVFIVFSRDSWGL